MLPHSQPVDPKFYKKLGLDDNVHQGSLSEQDIKSQRIGKMFDDFSVESRKKKISWKTRVSWRGHRIKSKFYDIKYAIRNRVTWRKTMNTLRPWEGFDGLICVMQTHLQDYIETEEKYGHSTEEYKNKKIATAKETVGLLSRMREPEDYLQRCREKVEAKYPKYKSLITEYKKGTTSVSGDFVAQGNGWVGEESGKSPRKGYFEFVNERFELVDSPDKIETERLLDQLSNYYKEIENAYTQAENDLDKDFERLGLLLKENLYSWWD